jgi:hypothetical protein
MKNLMLLAMVATSISAYAFTDSFENSVFTTTTAGGTITGDHNWTCVNASAPLGSAAQWFSGVPTVFPANTGTKYAATNFQAVAGANPISTWMMSDVITFNNGDEICFYSRTVNNPAFPDRLHLKLSQNGASTAVGDFSATLLTINPGLSTTGYPSTWTLFSAIVTGLSGPTSGRFAFNYAMPDGGPLGNNSDYIGVDDVCYTAVPEPATMAALGLGALAAIRRRRAK